MEPLTNKKETLVVQGSQAEQADMVTSGEERPGQEMLADCTQQPVIHEDRAMGVNKEVSMGSRRWGTQECGFCPHLHRFGKDGRGWVFFSVLIVEKKKIKSSIEAGIFLSHHAGLPGYLPLSQSPALCPLWCSSSCFFWRVSSWQRRPRKHRWVERVFLGRMSWRFSWEGSWAWYVSLFYQENAKNNKATLGVGPKWSLFHS